MIEKLRKRMKTLAVADAVLSPEWEYRYFSYNSKWSDTEELASMRDGCGNHWFLWLREDLAGYKCLSLDDGVMRNIESARNTFPVQYKDFLDEPAFTIDEATCIWHLSGSEWVKHGLSVRQIIDLEEVLAWTAEGYHSWATDYYETDIDITGVRGLFERPFNDEVARQLNPEVDLPQLKSEWEEIGLNA